MTQNIKTRKYRLKQGSTGLKHFNDSKDFI